MEHYADWDTRIGRSVRTRIHFKLKPEARAISWRHGAACQFATERFTGSSRTQKIFCRALQHLLNGLCFQIWQRLDSSQKNIHQLES